MNRLSSPYNLPDTQSTSKFKPALQYLLSKGQSNEPRSGQQSDLDLADEEIDETPPCVTYTNHMDSKTQQSSTELHPDPIPLINISRSPSPFARNSGLGAISDDDDDEDFDHISAGRPLVESNIGRGGRGWKGLLLYGGLGRWLFGTCNGWQVYIGLLTFWVLGCGFGLLLMNRFILTTGVYKFPYPLTMTFIQLCIAHTLLLGSASLTRLLRRPLTAIGFEGMIAPSQPSSRSTLYPTGFKSNRKAPLVSRIIHRITHGTGGIAGGGLLELDFQVGFDILPLAIVFVLKVVLSNLSFAYAEIQMYTLARIGIIPLSLLLSYALLKEKFSTSTLSAVLTATINLAIATTRPGTRITWESIVAGVFSTLFVSLYPIVLLRTHRSLTSALISHQPDVLGGFSSPSSGNTDSNGILASTRAFWQILHYTSLLSIIFLAPVLVLSGELPNIARNCYFLDVPFFLFLTFCGGLGSWAVFFSTLLLTIATSPLTVTFLFVPRSAWQLVMLEGFKMPVYSWVGVGLCWLCSLWFLIGRREEGRTLERLRLEGPKR